MKQLCRRGILPALLLVFCLVIPCCGAYLAGRAFEKESVFSGLSLGVSWYGEDPGNSALAGFLGKMRDVAVYCDITVWENAEAGMSALEDGTLDGLLILPADFAAEVMNDRNPDVELYVNEEHPLESLLLIWIGQSAADLLSASQAGIYAALAVYNANPSSEYSFDDVLVDVNLLFIGNALSRSKMFSLRKVGGIGSLTIAQHYFCSIFCFLLMTFAALYTGHCRASALHPLHRLQAVGRGCFCCWLSAVSSVFLLLLPFCVLMTAGTEMLGSFDFSAFSQDVASFAAQASARSGVFSGAAAFVLKSLGKAFLSALRSSFSSLLAASCGVALFLSFFVLFCRLAGRSMAGCSVISFVLSGSFLVISGGILPPTLMPSRLRSVMEYSPLTGLRQLVSGQTGLPLSGFLRQIFTGSSGLHSAGSREMTVFLLWGAAFAVLSFLLYRKTLREAEQ